MTILPIKRRHGNATFCGGWLGPQWPGSGPRDKCHGFVSGNDRPSVDLPPQSEIMYRIENVVVGAVWLVLLLVRYPVDINYAKIREITPCRPGREPKVAVVMVVGELSFHALLDVPEVAPVAEISAVIRCRFANIRAVIVSQA